MLSGKQKNLLRGRAHALRPAVTVGDAGASRPLMEELHNALQAHELVKVKLPSSDRYARRDLADQLCAGSGAELIQLLGRTAVLYRKRPEGS